MMDSTRSVRSSSVEVNSNFSVFFKYFCIRIKSYVIVQESREILVLNPLVIMNAQHPVQSFSHRVNNNPKDLNHH